MNEIEGLIKYILTQFKDNKIEEKTALSIIEQLSGQKKNVPDQAIAIIGMDCKLPDAENVDEYWRNLTDGRNSITLFPKNRRKDVDPFLPVNAVKKPENFYLWGGFLKEIDQFDGDFFRISPREAMLMEPCQRLVLESAYRALEDGNVIGSEGILKSVGVYVGLDGTDIHQYAQMIETLGLSDILSVTGSLTSIIAGRISYTLGLRGPALVIDTACSSGLVAVVEACKALNNNDCTVALVGGCNIMVTPLKENSILEIESASNEVRAFDQKASGIIFSEGVCFVALKKLDVAIRDKDAIYGVIRAGAVNNNGISSGLTAPNPDAQVMLYQKAWKDANINPETISYIEAQGTGTIIGDTVELESLAAAFRKYTDKTGFCGVGSVKSNIGHTKGASGIASLIKAVKALQNRVIPATINFESLNPKIKLDNSPLYINHHQKKWELPYPLRAGVNSFGFNGTNAHIVVEECNEVHNASPVTGSMALFTLSAKNEQSLKTLIQSHIDFLYEKQNHLFEEICYTANTCRPHFAYRIIMLAKNIADLRAKLILVASQPAALKEQNIYYGICTEKSESQMIEIPDTYAENREDVLKAVCEHYIRGGLIPWRKIYSEKLHKVHLPGYAFQKKRAWVDTEAYNKQTVKFDRLHPLVDELLINTHEQAIYKTRLSASTHWSIAEHQVYGRHVLPGSSLIDMITYIGASQLGKEHFCLRDLVFLQTISLEEDEFLDLYVLIKKVPEKMEFQIISKDNADSPDFTIHMTGKFTSCDSREGIQCQSIKMELRESSDSYPFYHARADNDLFLGPRWNVNGTIYQGKTELLADIEVSLDYESELKEHSLYPPLMDVAMNYVVGIIGDDIYIPFSIKELHIYGEMSSRIFSYVTTTDNERHSDEIIYVDVALMNDKNEIFAFLHQYAIKKLRSKNVAVRSEIEREKQVKKQQAIVTYNTQQNGSVTLTGKSFFTPTEQLVGNIWGKILGFEVMDVMTDIYKLGGDSIHSIQITNKINKSLNSKLDIVHIFDYPTISELSAFLDSTANDLPEGCELETSQMQEYRLSEIQLRIWVIQRLFPDIFIYNLPLTIRLDFSVDPAVIEKTVNVVIKRNSVFRKIFIEKNDGVCQIILDEYHLALEVVDYSNWCNDPDAAENAIYSENNISFDFSKPLFVAKLYKIKDDLHYLFFNIHHLICDGWSSPLFFDELKNVYRDISAGVPVDSSEKTPRYVDWIAVMEEWKRSDDYLKQKKYWENELSGTLPVIDLPLDNQRPDKFTYRGDAYVFFLDHDLHQRIKNILASLNYTGNIMMQSLFFLFLHMITEDDDIIIGIPTAGRDHASYEKVIGVFINTLCIRLKWDGLRSLGDLFAEVKRKNHGALRNGRMPFADLIRVINPERDMSRNPIFSVFFQYYDNIPPINKGTSQFDLSLYCRDEEEGIYCRFEYNTDLFSNDTICKFSNIFVEVVKVVTGLLDAKSGENKKAMSEKTALSLSNICLTLNQEVMDEVLKARNQEKYWRKKLAGEWPDLHLPCDFSITGGRKYDWEVQCLEVEDRLVNQINNICKDEKITMPLFLLTVYIIILSQYSKQEEIMVGTCIDSDFSSNILPLRISLSDDISFSAVLREVKRLFDEARLHDEYSFEKMAEIALREHHKKSFLDAEFVYIEDQQGWLDRFSIIKGESYPGNPEIIFVCKYTKQKLHLEIRYCSELFKHITIQRLGGHMLLGLEEFSLNFGQDTKISGFVTTEESAWIEAEINSTSAPYAEDATLVDLFHAQAHKHSEKTALVFEGKKLTYLELNERANRLAHLLVENGVGPDKIVGVMLERSPEMIIAILGILKSGGAYLPLDANTPRGRIDYILDHAGVDIIIVSEKTESGNSTFYKEICIDSQEFAERSTDNLPVRAAPENLAYIIYTSGSTGKPKGVMVSHKNANNFLNWSIIAFRLNNMDKLMLVTSFSFDISVFEIFGALLAGAELHVISNELLYNPSVLGNYCRKNGITIWHSVPSFMVQYLFDFDEENREAFEIKSLRHVMLGGEAWSKDLACKISKVFQNVNVQITNMYGPTETTIWVTSHVVNEQELGDNTILPIGRPIFNNKVYILDDTGKLCGIGLPGEIYISGDSVTPGYYKDTERTSENFILHPQYGNLYRTGDLGKYAGNGTVAFLGRKDSQVKIRGYRIELAEIENALAKCNEINQSAVVIKKDGETNKLICYYQAKEKLAIKTLRNQLAQKLPEYMIPSHFIHLPKMPLNSNGKIDRKELLSYEIFERTSMDNEYIEPATENEKILAGIWGNILKLKKVGVNDDFFALGGDSIKLVQVAILLKEYQLEVDIMDCFKYKTISELSKQLKRTGAGQADSVPLEKNELEEENWDHYPPQFELSGIEPFNDIFYKGCFYSAYLPIVNYFGKSMDLILANDIALYSSHHETSEDIDLGIEFISIENFDEIQRTIGLKIEESTGDERITGRIIRALSFGKPVIISVDCFFENIRTDMFNKNHWPHFLLVYGYDIERQVFYIIEHDDVNNLTFKKCEIEFKTLEQSHNGYIQFFGAPDDRIYFEFFASDNIQEDDQQLQGKTAKGIYVQNLIESKNMIYKGLLRLKEFVLIFTELSADEMLIKKLNLDQLLMNLNGIVNSKKSEVFKLNRLFDSDVPFILKLNEIAESWLKIRLMLERYKISIRNDQNSIKRINETLQKILDMELSYYETLYEYIERNNAEYYNSI